MEKETFIAGTGRLSPAMERLQKMTGVAIFFCRKGWAQFTIDLKQYDITEGIQVVLLPGSVLHVDGKSSDFLISYLECPGDMFREAGLRLDPPFFHFIKENPCYKLPAENRKVINRLMDASEAIYEDRDHCFRLQIIKNHLQCFLMDIYDKCQRCFTRQQIEGKNRQDELFKRFMALVHEHCVYEREVNFYADRLYISTKYLTGICRNITGKSAKKMIDSFVILEIKVLLQSTQLSIQEIADKLYFPDQSYLGRYFKRHEKISPVEYRNRTTGKGA